MGFFGKGGASCSASYQEFPSFAFISRRIGSRVPGSRRDCSQSTCAAVKAFWETPVGSSRIAPKSGAGWPTAPDLTEATANSNAVVFPLCGAQSWY